jgi:hypothetical protein
MLIKPDYPETGLPVWPYVEEIMFCRNPPFSGRNGCITT